MSESKTIIVLADCHIHPGAGIAWPEAALAAFQGADLIITLGDMGESSGLDQLETIAPVVGVKGEDDEDDPRSSPVARVVQAGALKIGCVFDPVKAGIALGKDPLDADPAAQARLFGQPVDILLWASTHIPSASESGGQRRINPGSATMPDKGSPAAFARLVVSGADARAEIVAL